MSLPKDMSEVIMSPFMKKKHTMEEERLQYKRSDCKIIFIDCSLGAGSYFVFSYRAAA
jgi:hypothetical protein